MAGPRGAAVRSCQAGSSEGIHLENHKASPPDTHPDPALTFLRYVALYKKEKQKRKSEKAQGF
jgi:hypothetical protein